MTKLPQQIEVLVVGAGPAGTACARTLALAGLDVLLLDQVQAHLPSDQSGQCLSATVRPLLLEMGLLPWLERSAPQACDCAFAAWGNEQLTSCDFMHAAYCGGWHLDRRRFDTCLRAAAIDAGAQFAPARLQQLNHDAEGWQCQLDTGFTGSQAAHSLRARWLIDASGRRAICAQHIGIARRHQDGLVALYASGKNTCFDKRTIIETVPDGWWYSAALPGERRLATLHVDSADASRIVRQPGLWQEKLRATRFIAQICALDESWCTPHSTAADNAYLQTCHGADWLAVGDAALSFDPLLTQGLVSALDTGWHGARALLASLAGNTGALAQYGSYLQQIQQRNRAQLLRHYLDEQRWPQQPFWAGRHLAAQEWPGASLHAE